MSTLNRGFCPPGVLPIAHLQYLASIWQTQRLIFYFLLFTFEFCYCALKLLVGLALAALPVWKMTVTNAMMHENNPVSANTSQEIPTR